MSKLTRPSVKMSKVQAAEALAKALNFINHLQSRFYDELTQKESGDFHELCHLLTNDDVRADYMNNGTLDSRDLI
jgi:hypothetical protein